MSRTLSERRRAIAAAKVQIGRTGQHIGQEAILLHGGIGMTQEYKVGHYFKRMTMIDRLFAGADVQLKTLARLGVVWEHESGGPVPPLSDTGRPVNDESVDRNRPVRRQQPFAAAGQLARSTQSSQHMGWRLEAR